MCDRLSSYTAQTARSLLGRSLLVAALWAVAAASPAHAEDKSGVAPNRVKLPKGPGSLEGVGENVEPQLNMGLMSYGVPIAVPEGYAGLSPSLRVGYSSGAGSSVVGIGWNVEVPSIERATVRGLPRYGVGDTWVVGGGTELVALTGSSYFRARDEGAFTRYRWVGSADMKEGYFVAEFRDGTIGYFGADRKGASVESAIVRGEGGIFRLHLVERVDRLGHVVRYDYVKDGQVSLVDTIRYAGVEDGDPKYAITWVYGPRPDELSDAKPGVELRTTKRLIELKVSSHGEMLRRYAFSYDAGRLTRLKAIEQFGRGNAGPHPVRFAFEYTGDLASTAPEFVTMTPGLGIDLAAGSADLIDMDADGLPDLVDTARTPHVVHLNVAGKTFTEARVSAFGAVELASPSVSTLDVDGDGLTDLVDAESSRVLRNGGAGDWSSVLDVAPGGIPGLGTDRDIRPVDLDNDRRIDLLRVSSSGTWAYMNQGAGVFALDTEVDALDVGFVEHGLEFADMNGDGLQDLVLPSASALSYWLNLGRGRFAPETVAALADSGGQVSLANEARLIDLDGDGPVDLVVVRDGTVLYALNEMHGGASGGAGGTTFGRWTSLSKGGALAIPSLEGHTLRFADMNGSGSVDVVWSDTNGKVSYLEIFPTRPNLLKTISNGIGQRIDIEYGSSTEHRARDLEMGRAWSLSLPNPVLTVDRITVTDAHAGATLPDVQEFRYTEGYYDGTEHEFRGFKAVEVIRPGDTSVEEGRAESFFDVGDEDRYRKGLLLRERQSSGGRSLRERANEYDDCAVDGVPAEQVSRVRFVCRTRETETVQEGQPEAEWLEVTTESRFDGSGNVVHRAELGVTSKGKGACNACTRPAEAWGEPCGPACTGDERHTETDYITPRSPDDPWILDRKWRERVGSVAGAPSSVETLYRYDGPPFEGLPEGQLTRGLLTHVVGRFEGGEVSKERYLLDPVHGVVLEAQDPMGHRRTFEWDERRLFLEVERVHLDDGAAGPSTLEMRVSYDKVLGQVVESTDWGLEGTPGPVTAYRYDPFARLEAVAKPGDRVDAPTETYEYNVGAPVSAIVRRTRSRVGGPLDLAHVQCFDARGRALQTRQRIEGERFQVTSAVEHNRRGQPVKAYQPYVSGAGETCAGSVPSTARFSSSTYDAEGRLLTTVHADGDLYGGTPSESATVHLPLVTQIFDEEDQAGSSPFRHTPTTEVKDGLGRLVRIERYTDPGHETGLDVLYDGNGFLRGHRDAGGHEKRQISDRLGRVVRVDDPDTGTTRLEYDLAGRVVRRTDARGLTTRQTYDAVGRLVRKWQDGDDTTAATYVYDQLADCDACTWLPGRLAAIDYAVDETERGRDTFGYTSRGLPAMFGRELRGETLRFWTDYDNADRVVATRYPFDFRVDQTLDGAGRVTQIAGFARDVRYHDNGLVASVTFGNGVRSTYEHDARLRLRNLTTVGPQAEPLYHRALSYDRVGNPIRIERNDENGTPVLHAEHTYDAAYRLLSSRLAAVGDLPEEKLRFAYDDLDNLTLQEVRHGGDITTREYTYGDGQAGPHAVTRAGETLEYDAAGFPALWGERAFSFDHLGRLRRIEVEGEPARVGHYGYGPDSDRVKKVEDGHEVLYFNPSFELRDGVPTVHVLLNGRRIAKAELERGAPTWLPDLAPTTFADVGLVSAPDGRYTAADAWLAQTVEEDGFVAVRVLEDEVFDGTTERMLHLAARRVVVVPETIRYYEGDHLDTTGLVTREDGTVEVEYEHRPYGEVRMASGYFPEDEYFTGKERDATGLHNLGARYYASSLGRWLAPDPAFLIWNEESLKRPFEAASVYAYVGNRPLHAVDPTGLEGEEKPGREAAGKLARDALNCIDGMWGGMNKFLPEAGVAPLMPVAAKVLSYGNSALAAADLVVNASQAWKEWKRDGRVSLETAGQIAGDVVGLVGPYVIPPLVVAAGAPTAVGGLLTIGIVAPVGVIVTHPRESLKFAQSHVSALLAAHRPILDAHRSVAQAVGAASRATAPGAARWLNRRFD